MLPRVYLAGPDVFFREPEVWAGRKKALCAQYGLEGVSPLDPFMDEPAEWDSFPPWRRIAARNEAHIRSCQAVIANLTPFRGPGADAGTVYELGYARALGLVLFGYATTEDSFLSRTRDFLGGSATAGEDGSWRDAEGLLLEDFGLFDNLMIEGGILGSNGALIVAGAERWNDLTVFERCVVRLAERYRG